MQPSNNILINYALQVTLLFKYETEGLLWTYHHTLLKELGTLFPFQYGIVYCLAILVNNNSNNNDHFSSDCLTVLG